LKLPVLKQEVYSLTGTENTQQLRKERPDLTSGRDLRYKVQWLEVIEQIKAFRTQGLDISLAELGQSEQMLKESLFEVGRLAGLDDSEIETDWQRIQLEAQFGDIHFEELP
jgi:hypothetical protein